MQVAFINLGNGKSSFLYAGARGAGEPLLVMTDNPAPVSGVIGIDADLRSYNQTNDLNELEEYIKQNSGRQFVFNITTDPERGKQWLDRITPILKKHKVKPAFFLPQSPNPYAADFAEYGTVIIGDYYMGIGGVKFFRDNAFINAKLKESLRAAIIGDQELGRALLPKLSLGRRVIGESPISLALLPTNAILHTVGILAHTGAILIPGRELNYSTTGEYFNYLDKEIAGASREDIISRVGKSLQGIIFYNQMPAVGPNIIMPEISRLVSKMRKKLISANYMKGSDLDSAESYIEEHLMEKYWHRFQKKYNYRPDEVDFARFVNSNEPYLNKSIQVPTKPDGTINTGHRFFKEELPTMAMLYRLGKALGMPEEELKPIKLVIELNQKLCGKEYLAQSGDLSKDSPSWLRGLTMPAQFVEFFNITGKNANVSAA